MSNVKLRPLYTFCNGDPVNKYDPTGLASADWKHMSDTGRSVDPRLLLMDDPELQFQEVQEESEYEYLLGMKPGLKTELILVALYSKEMGKLTYGFGKGIVKTPYIVVKIPYDLVYCGIALPYFLSDLYGDPRATKTKTYANLEATAEVLQNDSVALGEFSGNFIGLGILARIARMSLPKTVAPATGPGVNSTLSFADLRSWHNAMNAKYTYGQPPGGHWTQGVGFKYRLKKGLIGTDAKVHHWLIPQNQWAKNVPNYIKNQPWNFKVVSSRAAHARIDTAFTVKGVPPYVAPIRVVMAMPGWAQATTIGISSGIAYIIIEGEGDDE